jgi:N-ethylmaleimide reductase
MTSFLFTPLTIGAINSPNRILMAPLTRCRADAKHVPSELMETYYAQRASAGLIIAECTMVCPDTSAFATEPGIYNSEQVAAWKKVTDAVHAKGGRIFLQIWHAGRAAHPALNDGKPLVSSSDIANRGAIHTPQGKLPFPAPRALSTSEIADIVQAFADGANRAIQAGFDGVEVHAANGYLIDQFLRDGANKRSDEYGGSLANRSRFLLEVVEAVSKAIGSDKVGVRISPNNSYNSMKDSDPLALVEYVATALNAHNLAYLHIMRSDFFGIQHADVLPVARQFYKGVLLANMGYTATEAEQAIANGLCDAVAFGTGFLANPDLPARIQQGAEWNAPKEALYYTPGAEGYTDYPTL